MVPEGRQHRDRSPLCPFDVLFQVCFITAAILMIGSVIFSAFAVRLELNAMRKRHDEQLGKLELQLKHLASVVKSELSKGDLHATHSSQAEGYRARSDLSRTKKRGKSAQRQNLNSNTKGSKSYGIFFAKTTSYLDKDKKGISTIIDWESCADNTIDRILCPLRQDITIKKSRFHIHKGGIYYLSFQLLLRESDGIKSTGSSPPKRSNSSSPKFLLEILYELNGTKKSLLSLVVQDEHEKILQLSGLAYIPVSGVVFVHLRPFPVDGSNSNTTVTRIMINDKVRIGNYLSLLLVKPEVDGSDDQM